MGVLAQLRADSSLDGVAVEGYQARVGMVVAFFIVLAGFGIWWFFLSRKRLMQDLPTTATKGVALGLNELVGVAESNQSEPSPQSGVECVWWKNEFYVEQKTKNGTTWKKTKERQGGPPWFTLSDDHGSIDVRPRKASITGDRTYDGPYSSALIHDDPNPTLVSRYLAGRETKKRRVVEHVIPEGATVYTLGTARLPHERLEPYIGSDETGKDPFLIRVGSEADAIYRERVGAIVGGFLVLAGAAGGGLAWHDGGRLATNQITWGQVDPVVPAVFATGAAALMGLASLIFVYNGLIRLRQRAQAAWGLIDVQLRRRHDLIPALRTVVEAHAAHESELQVALAALRSHADHELPEKLSDDAVAAADRAIVADDAAVDRLLALAEGYPELTADESFRNLRAELVDTEDRIALARSFYNNSVQSLHDRAGTFPSNLVAWIFELDLAAEFNHGDGAPDVRNAAAVRAAGATDLSSALRRRARG